MTVALTPRIPATLLYWGWLPAPTTSMTGSAIAYRFERVLPVPVDHLHLTHTTNPDGSVLVIGIEPERLRSHLATRTDVTPDSWELVPDHLPEHLAQRLEAGQAEARLQHLNLLHGLFEPGPRRRVRQRILLCLIVGALMTSAMIVLGVERRARHHDAQAELLITQTRTRIMETLALPVGERHPELRLTMETRRLDQATRSAPDQGLDPAAALTALWRIWPPDLRSQIETIATLPDRLVIRGTVPSLADAERVAEACRGIDPALNLRIQPLQAQVGERGAGFLVTLVHEVSGSIAP